MMKFRSKQVVATLPIIVLVAFVGHFIVSEISYSRLKDPTGIDTIFDFYSRFGTSAGANTFVVNETQYVELAGPLPPLWSFAIPSGRPEYVFDQSGNFVDWCSDPGDSPSWRNRWPQRGGSKLSDSEVRVRFGIKRESK